MLAHLLKARDEAEQRGLVDRRLGNDRRQGRLALSQGAGLVDHDRVDPLHHFERFGVTKQDAQLRAATRADHDRHGRGQAKRTRARDDQHGDGVHEGMGHARLGPPDGPDREGHDGHQNYRRDEPAGHGVRQALDRRTGALRLADQPDDLCQQRVAADALRLHHKGAGAVDGATGDLARGGLLHGNGFARHHGLVDGRRAFRDDAVHRHALTRSHAQPVADRHVLERHILLCPRGIDPPCRRGREAQQLLDRRAGLTPCSQFEDLAEQHEHDDDRRRLEVDADLIAVRPERCGEEVRRKRRHHAECVRRAHAQGDECEHV